MTVSVDNLILTLAWLVPAAGALLILLLPRRQELAIKITALVATLAAFGVVMAMVPLYFNQTSAATGAIKPLVERARENVLDHAMTGDVAGTGLDTPLDLVTRNAWIPNFNIEYYLGVDGISLSLLLLTGLTSVLACLASWNIEKQVKGYFALFMVLVASMMGVFMALDLILFFVFFEVMLLPMYFLIAVWGGPRREYAAIKFLLYTLSGSVLILVGVLLLYYWAEPATITTPGRAALHTFDMMALARQAGHFGLSIQTVIFALFFVGFAVKLPSAPFHTWLPDAHVEAPTPISMILAGVLLKIGGYGFVRIAWPLAPLGAEAWAWWVALIGVISILYGALVAMAQTDFKKLVAYSSVSHMGYVTLGMASMNLMGGDYRYYSYGVNGAMFMMIAHGITSVGMFFLVGVIYDRVHHRDLNRFGGLLTSMPGYAAVSFLIFFGSMGLPGLCGFIAEVFVVLSAFHFSRVLAVAAACAVVFTAAYILWTLQRVFLGKNEQYRGLPDLSLREWTIAVPLVILTVALGVLPQPLLLSWMGPSVDATVQTMAKVIDPPAVAAPKVALAGGPPSSAAASAPTTVIGE